MNNFTKYRILRELSGPIPLVIVCLISILFSVFLFLGCPLDQALHAIVGVASFITVILGVIGTIGFEWAVVGLIPLIIGVLLDIVTQ